IAAGSLQLLSGRFDRVQGGPYAGSVVGGERRLERIEIAKDVSAAGDGERLGSADVDPSRGAGANLDHVCAIVARESPIGAEGSRAGGEPSKQVAPRALGVGDADELTFDVPYFVGEGSAVARVERTVGTL